MQSLPAGMAACCADWTQSYISMTAHEITQADAGPLRRVLQNTAAMPRLKFPSALPRERLYRKTHTAPTAGASLELWLGAAGAAKASS